VNAQSSPGSPSSPKSQSSPRSRIGPNWQNGEDRRTRILRAAAELFTAKGYAGVSMDEVQSKVGGSKSTLYRHFADKTDLFRSAVEMMIDERNSPTLDFRPPRRRRRDHPNRVRPSLRRQVRQAAALASSVEGKWVGRPVSR
jgi:AcrR family transcriptional regulator